MSYPLVADIDTTSGTVTSNSSSWTLTYPTNIAAGDLLLAFVATDGSGMLSAGNSGWETYYDYSLANSIALLVRNASGSESGTFSLSIGGSEQGSWIVYRVPAGTWFGGTPSDGAAARPNVQVDTNYLSVLGANGSGLNPDPESVDPANWATEDTLWFAVMSADTSRTVSAYPSSPDTFTDTGYLASGGSQGATLAYARLEKNASSVDPGTFTISNSDDWVALTIAIRPRGATQVQKFSQAQAKISTTRNHAQAQTHIKVTNIEGFAQAQASIKGISNQWTQAEAYIKAIVSEYSQAQATITVPATIPASIYYAEGLGFSVLGDTWTDAAEVASTNLVANKTYLIIVGGFIENDSGSAQSEVRVGYGATPTIFTDGTGSIDASLGTTSKTPFGFMFTHTQGGSAERYIVQVRNSSASNTVAGDLWIAVIRLSDELIANTDYYTNSVTADYSTTASYASQASITFTPSGSDPWLVLGHATRLSPTTDGTSTVKLRINDSVANALVETNEDGGDITNDIRPLLMAVVYVPSNASHTVSIDAAHSGTVAGTIFNSSIFALNLSKFADISYERTAGDVVPATDPSWTTVATVSPTPSETGDWLVLGYLTTAFVTVTSTRLLKTRLQINPSGGGLASDPAYGDDAPGMSNWDTADLQPVLYLNKVSLTSGAARTINLDASVTNPPGTYAVRERTLVAVPLLYKGSLATYKVSAQARTQIKQVYQSWAQAQTNIKATYNIWAQADAYIKSIDIEGFAQAQAGVKQVYNIWAQSNTYIKIENKNSAQAQTWIKKIFRGYAQVQGIITHEITDASDTFTRSVSSGWGTADVGGPWTIISGTASHFNVDGTKAYTTISSAGDKTIQLSKVLLRNTIVKFKIDLSLDTSQNAYLEHFTNLGSSDIPNTLPYGAHVGIRYSTTTDYGLIVGIGNTTSTFDLGWTLWPGEVYIKAQTINSNAGETTIRAKAWIVGESEPANWMTSYQKTHTNIFAGHVGFNFEYASSTNRTVYIDDYEIFEAGIDSYAQAQAKIKAIGVNSHSQAQAQILAAVTVITTYAQADAWIKQTYRAWAQASASIKSKNSAYSQASVWIKQTYPFGGGSTTIGQDTFTDSDKLLTTHTPEVGTSWTTTYQTTSDSNVLYWRIDNNQAALTGTNLGTEEGAETAASLVPTMSDGYVQGALDYEISGLSAVLLRQPTGNLDTFYFAGYNAAGIYLYRMTDGVITSLGTVSGTGAWVRLQASGSSPTTLKVERQTTEGALGTAWSLETSDNTVANQTSSGYVGIYGSGYQGIDTTKHAIVDNFLAVSGTGVTGPTFAQVQAKIKATSNSFAQAGAKISTTRVHSQSQTWIKQTYNNWAQSEAYIYSVAIKWNFAQAETWVKTTTSQPSQASVWIKTTYNRGYAQAAVWIKQTYPRGGGGDEIVGQDDFSSTTPDVGVAWSEIISSTYETGWSVNLAHAYFDGAEEAPGWQGQEDEEYIDYSYGVWILDTVGSDMTDGYVQGNLTGLAGLVIRRKTSSDTLYLVDYTGNLYRVTNGVSTGLGFIGGSGNWYRFQATGSSPTYLKAERRATQGELGTGWTLETSDNTTANQVTSGEVGLWAHSSSTFIWIDGSWQFNFGNASYGDDFLAVSSTGGVIGPTFAQAQAAIKTSSTKAAQSQAHIKATYRQFAQAQAAIKQTYYVWAQSGAQIKQTYRGYAQAEARIIQTYQSYAQAQAKIATTRVHAQVEASILATSNAFAQTNAYIAGQISWSAQAQATVAATSAQFAQAEAWIEITTSQFAQAQGWIKSVYIAYSQVEAQIKLVRLNPALAIALISGDYTTVVDSFSRSLTDNWGSADTGGTYTIYGGNNARFDVSGTTGTYAKTSNTYDRIYLPRTFINNSESIISLTLSRPNSGSYTVDIETHLGSPISNTTRNGYNISIITNSSGNIQIYVRNRNTLIDNYPPVTLGIGETLLIKFKTYQTSTGVRLFGKAWVSGNIEPGWHVVGDSTAPLPPGFVGITFPSELVNPSPQLITFDNWNIYEAHLEGYAQAQTRIKTIYNVSAQVAAWISTSYQNFSQAQGWIENTYNTYAQTQAHIETTYNVFAQASVWIKNTYNGYAQAQTYIILSGLNGYGQAQALILQTYRGFAQVNAYVIVRDIEAYAQAATTIKASYSNWAQAEAHIKVTDNEAQAQAQALIKQTYNVFAQSQAYIKTTDVEVYAQAGAEIKATYNVHAQADAYISTTNVVSAQAQAQIYTPQHVHPVADISNDGWRGVVI